MSVIPSANPLIAIDVAKLTVAKTQGSSTWPTAAAPPAANAPADNDPSNRYATIQKDGKTIATFYRSGLMVAPNGVALPNDLAIDGHGLSLANQRIQQMLKMYGGDVEYVQDTRMRGNSAAAATLFAAQLER